MDRGKLVVCLLVVVVLTSVPALGAGNFTESGGNYTVTEIPPNSTASLDLDPIRNDTSMFDATNFSGSDEDYIHVDGSDRSLYLPGITNNTTFTLKNVSDIKVSSPTVGFVNVSLASHGTIWTNLSVDGHTQPVSISYNNKTDTVIGANITEIGTTNITIDDNVKDLMWNGTGDNDTVALKDLSGGEEVMAISHDSDTVLGDGVVSEGGTLEITLQTEQKYISEFKNATSALNSEFFMDRTFTKRNLISGENTTETINVESKTNSTVNINVSTDEDWIDISSTGILLEENQTSTITFNINTTGLSAGRYSGSLLVEGNNESERSYVVVNVQQSGSSVIRIPFIGAIPDYALVGLLSIVVIVFVGGWIYIRKDAKSEIKYD